MINYLLSSFFLKKSCHLCMWMWMYTCKYNDAKRMFSSSSNVFFIDSLIDAWFHFVCVCVFVLVKNCSGYQQLTNDSSFYFFFRLLKIKIRNPSKIMITEPVCVCFSDSVWNIVSFCAKNFYKTNMKIFKKKTILST